MAASFKAVYYNGKSSRGYDALLLPKDDFLFISYLNEGEEPVYVQWQLAAIRILTSTGSVCTFQYGEFPFQSVVTDNPLLVDLLQPAKGKLDHHYHRLLTGGWKTRLSLAGIFMGVVALFYLFIIPGLAAFLAGQLPQAAEVALGQQLYVSVMHEYEKDEHLSQLANDFSRELAFNTDYPIEITVVKHYERNAFAMPGGHIVIYDALLRELESPEAFAALLGHEVAHVKYRHSLKSISRALSSYLFVSFILSDLNGITAVLIENASMLSRLSYSRELEKAADEEALAVLVMNRLDQQGLVLLMETLEKNEYLSAPELLSSHPLTQDRISAARQQIKPHIAIKEHKTLLEIWRQIKE